MFFDSQNMKILEAGVQLTSASQNLHMQNIANIETPGYKSQSLSFDAVLEQVQKYGADSVPATIYADIVSSDDISLLPDGNNVDIEYENIQLYKDYAQYSMLLSKIQSQFDQYSYVLNSNFN